jgi:hypothetical protein
MIEPATLTDEELFEAVEEKTGGHRTWKDYVDAFAADFPEMTRLEVERFLKRDFRRRLRAFYEEDMADA